MSHDDAFPTPCGHGKRVHQNFHKPSYNERMSPLQIRLLSLAAFAVFCATATWWGITLATNHAAPVQAAAARAPVSLDQAGTLFGGRLERNPVQDIHLFGILSLAQGAAAIVSVGGEPPRAISLGGPIDQ